MNHVPLRAALRAKYGPRNYRITYAGEVHIYGIAPSTNNFCWWLLGDVEMANLWTGVGS